jgi:hypothetical protein
MSTVHVHNIPICPETRFKYWFGFEIEKGRIILPPSIGHGEGSAGHRTASSCAILESKLALEIGKGSRNWETTEAPRTAQK